MSDLRAHGVALHLDDFGTGHSNLGRLRRVPADALKIDRSFVTRMPADPRCHEIVRGVIELAHSLGLEAIAEGVETPLHHQQLVEMGCDLAQGFFFSRPLPAAELEQLLGDGAFEIGEPVVH